MRRKAAAATGLALVILLVAGAYASGFGWFSRSIPGTAVAAPEVRYINLGDSFSAGTGVRPNDPDAPLGCLRSSNNYAQQLADTEDWYLVDVSCSGATTTDLFEPQWAGLSPQLDALDARADIVTVLIGGNDGGIYADSIRGCMELADDDPLGSPCADRYGDRFEQIVIDETGPSVSGSLKAIGDAAPEAQVVLVGYLRILPDHSCRPAMPVADGDVAYLNDLQDTLNEVLAEAAAANDVEYVDLTEISQGHDACQRPGVRFIEPVNGGDSVAAVHPNELGQRAMAQAVRERLTT